MYLKSTKDIKRRGESMIKKLAPYMKKYKTQLMLGVLCAALEAIFELLIPLVMAQIVDVGISNGNTTYTIKMGLFKVDGTLLDKWEITTRKEFQELYKRADKGLYEVKRTKKGTWHIV